MQGLAWHEGAVCEGAAAAHAAARNLPMRMAASHAAPCAVAAPQSLSGRTLICRKSSTAAARPLNTAVAAGLPTPAPRPHPTACPRSGMQVQKYVTVGAATPEGTWAYAQAFRTVVARNHFIEATQWAEPKVPDPEEPPRPPGECAHQCAGYAGGGEVCSDKSPRPQTLRSLCATPLSLHPLSLNCFTAKCMQIRSC